MAVQWSIQEAKLLLLLYAHLFSFSTRLFFFRSKIQFDFQVVFYKVGYAVGAIKRCHYYGPSREETNEHKRALGFYGRAQSAVQLLRICSVDTLVELQNFKFFLDLRDVISKTGQITA